MKRLPGAMLLVLPCVLVACPPPTETDTAPTTTTATTCVCDCPAGPPLPPIIDTFCAGAEDGTACCLGPNIGTCQTHECRGNGAPAQDPHLRGE